MRAPARGGVVLATGSETVLDVAPPEQLRLVATCPTSPGCSDEEMFSVVLRPDPLPPSLGPTLRAAKPASDREGATVSWARVAGAHSGYEVVGHRLEDGPPLSAVLEAAPVLGAAARAARETTLAKGDFPTSRLVYLKARALSPCGRPGPAAD